MSVYRYINNSSEPVVAGDHTVNAWDELILDYTTDELNFKVGTYLICYKDGVQLDSDSMPILDYVEFPAHEEVRLELYSYADNEPKLEGFTEIIGPVVEVEKEVVDTTAE